MKIHVSGSASRHLIGAYEFNYEIWFVGIQNDIQFSLMKNNDEDSSLDF